MPPPRRTGYGEAAANKGVERGSAHHAAGTWDDPLGFGTPNRGLVPILVAVGILKGSKRRVPLNSPDH